MAIIKIKTNRRTFTRKQKGSLGTSAAAYLVELITNADDSYKRLETTGQLPTDEVKPIYIDLRKEKNGGYTFSVTDNAEGMSSERVIEVFADYGGDTAGGEGNASRGIFGQGATDVMINAAMDDKKACLESIKDGNVCKFYFSWDSSSGDRTLEEKPVNMNVNQFEQYRQNMGIPNNGTRMTFGLPNEVNAKFKINRIIDEIEGAYPLRYILSADNRKVVFRYQGSENILNSSKYLLDESELLKSKEFTFTYDDVILNCSLTLYRNTAKKEQGDYATQILVVDSKQVIFANTMLGFDKMPKAKDVSGILVIDGLYTLCKKHLNQSNPDEIIKDDRTGFNERHEFYKKALQKHTDLIIRECLDEHASTGSEVDVSKNKKFKNAIAALNKWMSQELKETIGGTNPGINPPKDGLDFGKIKIEITAGVSYDLRLIINPEMIKPEDDIFINVAGNDEGFIKVTPEPMSPISYKPSDVEEIKNPSTNEKYKIVRKSISITAIKPTQENDELIITASTKGYSKSIMVAVVDKKVIYPENGIAFEHPESTFTPTGNHKSPVWFDISRYPVGTELEIWAEGLTILNGKIVLSEAHMVTDQIGCLNVVTSGGELGKDYNLRVTAKTDGYVIQQVIHVRQQASTPKGTNGMFSGIKISNDDYSVSYQIMFDDKEGILYISGKNPINIAMMGDLSNLDSENPKFTGKQESYLADLIALQSAIIDVRGLERKQQITVSAQDALDSYMQHINEKKVEAFKQINKAFQEA